MPPVAQREKSFENLLSHAQFGSWDNLAIIERDVTEDLESPIHSTLSHHPFPRCPSQLLLAPSFHSSRSDASLSKLVVEPSPSPDPTWQNERAPREPAPTSPPAHNTDPSSSTSFGVGSVVIPPAWVYELTPSHKFDSPEMGVLAAVCTTEPQPFHPNSTAHTIDRISSISSRSSTVKSFSAPPFQQTLFGSANTSAPNTPVLPSSPSPTQRASTINQDCQSPSSPSGNSQGKVPGTQRMKRRKVRHFDSEGIMLEPASSELCFQAESVQNIYPAPVQQHTQIFTATSPPPPSTPESCSTPVNITEIVASGSARPGDGLVLQCRGTNRKKRTRCRNAALMEYVGPRPLYCAEHIAMDPEALYHKCGFPLVGEGPKAQPKKCKEIVFKDFKLCYKHLSAWLTSELGDSSAHPTVSKLLDTASYLLTQLEREAAVAKIEDPELYQRKSKLLPKYHTIVRTLESHLATL